MSYAPRSPTQIREAVLESIAGLRAQAAAAARDAEQFFRGADETERDMANGDWLELARSGFISFDEAKRMLGWAVPNRRRTSRRRR